jgi:hypothetical protein
LPVGRYDSREDATYIELQSDGSVVIYSPTYNKTYTGKYKIRNDTVSFSLKGFLVWAKPMYLHGNSLVTGDWDEYVMPASGSTNVVAGQQPVESQPTPSRPKSSSAAPLPPPTVTPGSQYANADNKADRLQLHFDNTFALQESGQSFTGQYSFAGSTLTLHIVELQKDVAIAVEGENLVVNGSEAWLLQKAGDEKSAPADGTTPLADQTSTITGKYVFSKGTGKQSDYIQLGADGKFAQQVSGQSSSGSYTVRGDVVTLSPPSGRSSKARLAGDTLVEADGTRLAKQGGGSAQAAGLTIDQIIKMAQVKIPDDVIIATIKKSGAKYVLSPEELIKLKTAGVSDQVIRSMPRQPQ